MSWEQGFIVLAGALAGGFVNGLTGFGTGLTAIGIWLHVLSPATVAVLVIVCSVVSQVQTLPMIWRRMSLHDVWPFVVPGLVGVPVGSAMLGFVEPRAFKLGIGLLLVCYTGLASLHAIRGRLPAAFQRHRGADAVVGLGGGILGGLAGLSGPLLVIWTDLRGDSKEVRRNLLQSFNLAVLSLALAAHAAAGNLTADAGRALLFALPGTMLAAWLGARTYRRLGDRNYRAIVHLLLFCSGVSLLAANR